MFKICNIGTAQQYKLTSQLPAHLILVRELMGETLPPPPGEFRRPIFPKTLYPQLFRSACLHSYRGYICPGGPIEGRYLPHFRGGGDILGVGVVWTLAILWDTPNLLCWSSDQQVQLPNTFQKHRIPILGIFFKKRLKNDVFLQFFLKFSQTLSF